MFITAIANRLGVSVESAERYLEWWRLMGKVRVIHHKDHESEYILLHERFGIEYSCDSTYEARIARHRKLFPEKYVRSTQRRKFPPEDLDHLNLRTFGMYQRHPVRAYWHDPI